MADEKKANKLKDLLGANIKEPKSVEDNKKVSCDDSLDRFKNKIKKPEKKSFPLYMEKEKVDKLDKICKKVGQSRNVLINMILDEFLEKYN